jgi:hypothetical protein
MNSTVGIDLPPREWPNTASKRPISPNGKAQLRLLLVPRPLLVCLSPPGRERIRSKLAIWLIRARATCPQFGGQGRLVYVWRWMASSNSSG